jgi:hypothetical protein
MEWVPIIDGGAIGDRAAGAAVEDLEVVAGGDLAAEAPRGDGERTGHDTGQEQGGVETEETIALLHGTFSLVGMFSGCCPASTVKHPKL